MNYSILFLLIFLLKSSIAFESAFDDFSEEEDIIILNETNFKLPPDECSRSRPSIEFKNISTNISNAGFITPLRGSQPISNRLRKGGNIKYKIGNPVLTGRMNVHMVYYGKWTAERRNIVDTFVANIGKTKWFNIEKSYYYQARDTSRKIYTTGPISLGTRIIDNYSKGTFLFGNDIPNLLKQYIIQGHLPRDSTATYLFLIAKDVFESIRDDVGPGFFCFHYCGYHISFTIGEKRYFYALVGDVEDCIGSCTLHNTNVSPNGDPGIDVMLSVIAHELVEVMSDPVSDIGRLRAWEDADGYENADKCAFTYGPLSTLSNGAKYNMVIGSKKYLIQRNWHATLQKCVMSA